MSEQIRCDAVEVNVDQLPLCPWCEKTALRAKCIESETLGRGNEYHGELTKVVFVCQRDGCREMFIAVYYLSPNDNVEVDDFELKRTSPPQPILEIVELLNKYRLPKDLQDDLNEAAGCLKNSLYQSFVATARRAIHSICADKKAIGANLDQQITYLQNEKIFALDVANRAHEVRVFGNHGAHPELIPVTKEWAENCLQHLVWVTKIVYENAPPTDLNLRDLSKKAELRRYVIPKKVKKLDSTDKS